MASSSQPQATWDIGFDPLDLDADFYKNSIFEPEQVSLTQLLNISTQQLCVGNADSDPFRTVSSGAKPLPQPPLIKGREPLSETPSTNGRQPPSQTPSNKDSKPISETSTNKTSSGSDTASRGRFAKPLSADEIRQKQEQAIPGNTKRQNQWSTTVWAEWARYRNSQPETATEYGLPVPEDIEKFQSMAEMDYWLQRFVCEIRRKNGDPYPPGTLQQLLSGLQRHLRNYGVHVNFFKTDDQTFSSLRRTLDAAMKELTNKGVGVEVKSADPVTKDDEGQLWQRNVFSMTNAKGLSNAVFFYNGKVFGLRGGQEHIGLLAEQFQLGYDHENKRKYVKFVPRVRKNAQGGLSNSKNAKNQTKPITHYDTEEDSSHSVYKLFETYLNLIPRQGNFYRKPLNDLRFSASNIPQRELKTMMKNLFVQAGLSMEDRTISNHSGRVTLCTTLFNDRFGEKTVMNRSKHTSSAVRTYQREQFPLVADVCKSLEPSLGGQIIEPKPENHVEPSLGGQIIEPKPENHVEPSLGKLPGKSHKPSADSASLPSDTCSESTITLQIPNSVNKLVVIKSDGKKLILEI